MRVGIDATPLTVSTGGIRRYVVELTRSLATLYPQDQYYLMTDQAHWDLPSRLAGLPNVVRLTSEPPGALRAKWWSLGLPWEVLRQAIDVFHGADFSIPYLPVRPAVLVVHDLSPWKTGLLRPAGSDRVRRRTPRLLRLANRIITPSEAIRREVNSFFGIPLSRITATPLAAADSLAGVSESFVAAQTRKLGIDGPYLMFLGAGQQRKNLARLVEAWRLARAERPDLLLVVVGAAEGLKQEQIRHPGLLRIGHLQDKEVAGVLSGAAAFVYPSLYEGFGLPVLEAMQAGAPVITSRDPAITEVTAGAALQVDGTSESELCAAILSVVNHPELQERLKMQGRQRASRFSWRSTALLTHAAYVEAIRDF